MNEDWYASVRQITDVSAAIFMAPCLDVARDLLRRDMACLVMKNLVRITNSRVNQTRAEHEAIRHAMSISTHERGSVRHSMSRASKNLND